MKSVTIEDAQGNTWTQISPGAGIAPLVFKNGVLQNSKESMKYTIVTEEGRWSGARYHVAVPLDAGAVWPDMLEWVVNTFGPTAQDGIWTPGQRWYCNNARFYFRNEQDLTAFLLRWQ